MPRMARLESSGSLVHIMAHSVEGKNLFVDDEDKRDFLSRFEKGLAKYRFQCHAWTLMDNHYHLFLRTGDLPMSKLMRGLNGGYARYYNKRHKRRGVLFDGRFKSILCQEMDYAEQLIKYIHLNPLRAGMVKSLEQLKDWPWCGHGFLLGIKNANGENFQIREESLRRFGDNEHDAIIAYLESMSQCCLPGNETAGKLAFVEATEIAGSFKGWPAVIGDPEFVKRAMEKYKEDLHRLHRKADYQFVLEAESKNACTHFEVTIEELKTKGRKNRRSEARAVFCYRTHVLELIPLSVIAKYLGVSISSVAVLVKKGALQNRTIPSTQTAEK